MPTILALLGLLGSTLSPQVSPGPIGPTTVAGVQSSALTSQWFDVPRPVSRSGASAHRIAQTSFVALDPAEAADNPRDAAFTADGSSVLVANRESNSVTVFDFATRTVIANIAVGDSPVDVEVAPDGTIAAVPNLHGGTVSLIDISTLSLIATIPITETSGSAQPYRVTFDSASTTCFVGVINGGVDSRLSLIDLATMAETASIPTAPQGLIGTYASIEERVVNDVFTDFAVSSDGSYMLLPNRAGGRLFAYDLPSGALLADLAIGDSPAFVDISEDGLNAVVSLVGNPSTVVYLDVNAGVPTIVGTASTLRESPDPRLRITPDKSQVLVATRLHAVFIDLATLTRVNEISTSSIGDIDFSFDDRYAIVTGVFSNATWIIRLSDNVPLTSMVVGPTNVAAVSPVSHALVGLNNVVGEDVHFYSTQGGLSQFLGRALSGCPDEVDAPRRITLTDDGRTALIVGRTSRTIARFDVASQTVTDYYSIGDRGWEVATDAAGEVAVATSAGSDEVHVIDLVAGETVATLSVEHDPTEVVVSPDGSQAFVITTDHDTRVVRINLAGAASAVHGSLGTVRTRLFPYGNDFSSGMALSPDGLKLAVCSGFSSNVTIIDTATGAWIDRVTTGSAPVQCAWNPTSDRLYVTHESQSPVTAIEVGVTSASIAGTTDLGSPHRQVCVDGADEFLYVGARLGTNPRLTVIDTATMTEVASIPFSGELRHLELVNGTLFVHTPGFVHRLRAAGPSTTVLESVGIGVEGADLAFSEPFGLVLTVQPGLRDGIDITRFGGLPSNECGPGFPNSTGQPGRMEAEGAFLAGGLPLTLRAIDLPPDSFGYFLHSSSTGFVAQPGGSQGNLCLGGTIGRFDTQAVSSGPAGVLEIPVDTLSLPSVSGPVAILPGDTWSFQAWHRDANPGLTSNFTDRLTVTFE